MKDLEKNRTVGNLTNLNMIGLAFDFMLMIITPLGCLIVLGRLLDLYFQTKFVVFIALPIAFSTTIYLMKRKVRSIASKH